MSDREIQNAKGLGNQTQIKQRLEEVTKEMHGYNGYPDAKKHQIVSFFKSAVRLLGYGFIPFDLATATIILILSEIVGIVEELV